MRVLLAGLMLLTLVVGAVLLAQAGDKPPQYFVPSDHRVIYMVTQTKPDGSKNIRFRQRWARANGEWREAPIGCDDGGMVTGLSTDGSFLQAPSDKGRRALNGRLPNDEMIARVHSVSFYEKNRDVVRKETVAGLEGYTVRSELKNGYSETTCSPRTGITPLKFREVIGDFSLTFEALSVVFEPVPDNVDALVRPVKPRYKGDK
jgi:hypothetical protein